MKRPRYSLRSMLLVMILMGTIFGLWWRWEPWVYLDTETLQISELSFRNDWMIGKPNSKNVASPVNSNQKKANFAQLVKKLDGYYGFSNYEEFIGPDGIVLRLPQYIFKNWKHFTKNQERIVSNYQPENGTKAIRVWDIKTGQVLCTLKPPGKAILNAEFKDENTIRVVTYPYPFEIHFFHRRRPEYWWGIAWLWEFWATLIFGIALLWNLRRDSQQFSALKA